MALGKVCANCGNPRLQWDEKCSKCGGSFGLQDTQEKAAAALRAEIAAGCPSCGEPRTPELELCGKCGVVFAKWKAKREQETAAAQAAAEARRSAVAPATEQVAWHSVDAERPGFLSAVLFLTMAANAIAAVWLVMVSTVAPAAAPFLGAAAASALTVLFAVGIFCWQKWAAYGFVILNTLGILGAIVLGLPRFLVVKDTALLLLCLHWMLQVRHHFR